MCATTITRWRFGLYRLRHRARGLAPIIGVGALVLGACQAGIVMPDQVVSSAGWGELRPTYDGTVRAWATGTHQNRGNSVQLVDGSYRDTAADGNTVYVKVEWYIRRGVAGTTCSGSGQSFSCSNGTSIGWDSVGQTVTPEIWTDLGEVRIRQEGGLWVNSELAADGDAARAVPTACAQFGWPVPDPCARAVVSFAY